LWKTTNLRIGGGPAEIRTDHFQITDQIELASELSVLFRELRPLKAGLGVQFQHRGPGFEYLWVWMCLRVYAYFLNSTE
jgi:hypothetical protein